MAYKELKVAVEEFTLKGLLISMNRAPISRLFPEKGKIVKPFVAKVKGREVRINDYPANIKVGDEVYVHQIGRD